MGTALTDPYTPPAFGALGASRQGGLPSAGSPPHVSRLPWDKPRLALSEKKGRIVRTNKFQTKQHATTRLRGLITVEL